MMKKLTVLTFIMLVCAGMTLAADYYVRAGATGDGLTPTTPAGSITAFTGNYPLQDCTVHVARGTYVIGAAEQIYIGGNRNVPSVFRIKGGYNPANDLWLEEERVAGQTIFDGDNAARSVFLIKTDGNTSTSGWYRGQADIADIVFKNFVSSSGYLFSGDTRQNYRLIDCTIRNCSSTSDFFYVRAGKDTVIPFAMIGCQVYDCTPGRALVYIQDTYAVIENCVFANVTSPGNTAPFYATSAGCLDFVNNTAYNVTCDAGSVIDIAYTSQKADIVNSVFSHPGTGLRPQIYVTAGNEVDIHNCVFEPNSVTPWTVTATTFTESGNLYDPNGGVDVDFVSTSTSSPFAFTLGANSDAIDAGLNTYSGFTTITQYPSFAASVPATDIDGVGIVNGVKDMGAYEYVVVTPEAPVFLTADNAFNATINQHDDYTSPVPEMDVYGYPAPVYTLTTTPPLSADPNNGFSIDAGNGQVTWTDPSVLGAVTITVTASNSEGSDTLTWVLTVTDAVAPDIDQASVPPSLSVVENYQLSYQVPMLDYGSPACTFALLDAPAGMTINSSGLITWIAAITGDGATVEVKASNDGGSETVSFTLDVIPYTGPLPAGMFVAVDGSDVTGDGTPVAPYATIAKAHDGLAATGLSTIYVGGGTYLIGTSQTIPATDNRNILGGYNSTNGFATRDVATVLDGQGISRSGQLFAPGYRPQGFFMEGFTFQNFVSGSHVFLNVDRMGLEFKDCIFTDNLTTNGALFNLPGSGQLGYSKFTNCQFYDNTVKANGSIVNGNRTFVTMTNCVVADTLNPNAYGGVCYEGNSDNDTYRVDMINCTLYNNQCAAGRAGAVYMAGTRPLNMNIINTLMATDYSNQTQLIQTGTDTNYSYRQMALKNNLYDILGATPWTAGAVTVVDANNITGVSDFVSVVEPIDLQLGVMSDAINKGLNPDEDPLVPVYDIKGDPNYAGRKDIGAYEYMLDRPDSAPVIDAIADQVIPGSVPYAIQVTRSSGYPAPTWSLTTAPAGMAINANTGIITWAYPDGTVGTPIPVTVTATNYLGSDAESFNLTLRLPADPNIAQSTIFVAHDKSGFKTSRVTELSGEGEFVYTFDAASAALGMTVDSETGEVAWADPALGTYPVTVTASNWASDKGGQADSVTFAVIVKPGIQTGFVNYGLSQVISSIAQGTGILYETIQVPADSATGYPWGGYATAADYRHLLDFNAGGYSTVLEFTNTTPQAGNYAYTIFDPQLVNPNHPTSAASVVPAKVTVSTTRNAVGQTIGLLQRDAVGNWYKSGGIALTESGMDAVFVLSAVAWTQISDAARDHMNLMVGGTPVALDGTVASPVLPDWSSVTGGGVYFLDTSTTTLAIKKIVWSECAATLTMDLTGDCAVNILDLQKLSELWLEPFWMNNFADLASEWQLP